jgi:hypothetical protein
MSVKVDKARELGESVQMIQPFASDNHPVMRYRSGMRAPTKMDQRAGGHRWPFDGSKCIDCGMSPTRFADTKLPCSGSPLEREGFTVPDDDE